MSETPENIFSAKDLPPDIGEKLAELRREAGLSSSGLAAVSGVGATTILRVEKTGSPNPNTVLYLLKALLTGRDDIELADIVPDWPELDPRVVIGFGPRTRLRRRNLRLTLKTVAERAGISQALLSRFERGLGPTPKLIKFEQTQHGDIAMRLIHFKLAHALGFKTLAEHQSWCDL